MDLLVKKRLPFKNKKIHIVRNSVYNFHSFTICMHRDVVAVWSSVSLRWNHQEYIILLWGNMCVSPYCLETADVMHLPLSCKCQGDRLMNSPVLVGVSSFCKQREVSFTLQGWASIPHFPAHLNLFKISWIKLKIAQRGIPCCAASYFFWTECGSLLAGYWSLWSKPCS